ncbi:hypothetical protein Fuma_00956 [Fuerstiella marisgermanici]|uniref:Uncharacterized protein n=1 Tax=Fuerstiella marisgermanici TaxID=1891926 RepID=A0A1P8WBD0_9PLAN|nr:hypothetical protein Fuma_00956 [Fuerstiella marisgermanici]
MHQPENEGTSIFRIETDELFNRVVILRPTGNSKFAESVPVAASMIHVE